ncbi:MAG: tRNA (guanosine(37)-N1)-methyltransferase TrmD [Anaplasmataceae bacterium]|nr:tRNA (guanosine(37)-N1)-methyltransferase TrmD [Anaplasmataceae bacterium]
MKINLLTSCAKMFPGILNYGVIGRALSEDKWSISVIDMYISSENSHIDFPLYAGGSGMLLSFMYFDDIFSYVDLSFSDVIIYISPRGKKYNQSIARRLSGCNEITFLCGRFEGIDQRIIEYYNIIEVSIGDYILSCGELAAMVIVDSLIRLVPDVLGNKVSLIDESFSNDVELECNQYTRPNSCNDAKVPFCLSSGNHQYINNWKKANSKYITKFRKNN